MNSSKKITEQIPPPAYFGSLTITDVKCFKGEHTIDLSDGNGQPAMWTVILGNNNTGKTTLLRCLADLEPIKFHNSKLVLPKASENTEWKLEKYHVGSSILIEMKDKYVITPESAWWYESGGCVGGKNSEIGNLIIYGYGTSRKMGNSYDETENPDNTISLFDDNATLINAEKWLKDTDYASKNGVESAKLRLEKIKNILTNGLLPDVKNFKCTSIETNGKIDSFVEIETDDHGWVKLRELGYGYQVTLAWVVDLAQKMFIRYKDSENPLHEPAIVLVDEIDLHLHPEWQRKIISFLSEQFPRTQFIVTTHSPLIVQSAEDINLVLLKKEENHVVIEQPKLKTYRGWTVEEILSDLMGLDGKTKSDDYLSLIKTFNKAVMKDDYASAKKTYDELDALLHRNNIHRELLNLQLNALSQEADD
jgi:predicted ATP-binding protein involved in virulence